MPSGKAAAKACITRFYQYFISVNCLFDVDLAGIQIWQNIEQWSAGSDLAVHCLFRLLIALMYKSRRKLEQETYLD
ncbi:hypothetical protein [Parendozoicomonas haliclonae]|uniref:hypothetical protein n=1 Tax=Parendozoicomonas haliclonae TaxID=1960125 RepID=UPI0010559D85|nr:hypothetical protein [Parendozoicomonas haliclonae]